MMLYFKSNYLETVESEELSETNDRGPEGLGGVFVMPESF